MKGDRCCMKCRAIPGTCVRKWACPCHMESKQKPPSGTAPALRALLAEAGSLTGVRRA